ncbi:putative permease [Deinococcus peraridilitoris DSM 19664]|uniref:Putative permease n=1 Tax=Deinococcus peraridilitoris (strain DSM 19664 / LMG 22246 / CIP 109416 / KR-200) TaxID=937777 RepID=L0A2W9_DEIPD|nr:putative permease [Deinococcus peraridilitoris DSM 19664]
MYAAGFAVFLLLTTTDLISSIVGALLRNNASFALGLELYLARLPFLIGWVLPLAVPFAILIGFGRLAKDSELKALAAGGVRPISTLWPLVLLGLLVSAFGFYNANVLTPSGNVRFNDAWTRVWFNGSPNPPSQDLYTFRSQNGDTLFYAGRVQGDQNDSGRATLSGVLIQTPTVTYSAQTGIWDARRKVWEFRSYWETRSDRPPVFRAETRRVRQTDLLRPPSAPPEHLTLGELRQRARDTSLDIRDQRSYRFELQRRFADPLTALGFALAAGSLGLLLRNRAWSFAAIVLLIFSFYVVWSAMPQLVKLGAVPEMLAAWLPNVLLLLTSLIVARRLL